MTDGGTPQALRPPSGDFCDIVPTLTIAPTRLILQVHPSRIGVFFFARSSSCATVPLRCSIQWWQSFKSNSRKRGERKIWNKIKIKLWRNKKDKFVAALSLVVVVVFVVVSLARREHFIYWLLSACPAVRIRRARRPQRRARGIRLIRGDIHEYIYTYEYIGFSPDIHRRAYIRVPVPASNRNKGIKSCKAYKRSPCNMLQLVVAFVFLSPSLFFFFHIFILIFLLQFNKTSRSVKNAPMWLHYESSHIWNRQKKNSKYKEGF